MFRILVSALVLAGFSHQALGFCFHHAPKCQAEWAHASGDNANASGDDAKDCVHSCASHAVADRQPLPHVSVCPALIVLLTPRELVQAGPQREKPSIFLPPRGS